MKQIFTLLFCIVGFYSFSIELFWIGGNGQFSDPVHWSLTSGGATAGVIPSSSDTIHFDDNSGLTAASIIDVDVNMNVHTIYLNNLSHIITWNASVANNPLLNGSFFGNNDGITFAGTWGTMNLNPDGNHVFESNGIQWPMSFLVAGDTINFSDGLNIFNNTFSVTSGVVNFAPGVNINCGIFQSTGNTLREITVLSDTVFVSLGNWNTNGNNLTVNAATTTIILGDNLGLAGFSGGGAAYGNVISSSALSLSMTTSSTIDFLAIVPSSTWLISSGQTITLDSLAATGTCLNELNIQKAGAGADPMLVKTGYPNISLQGTNVINVDITITGTATIIFGSILGSSNGWTEGSGKLYWVNNSGIWNQNTNWSLTSGGAVSGCIPSIMDTVIFDANSFSLANQIVSTTDTSYAKVMIWENLLQNQTLLLDSNLYVQNDVFLHNNLTFHRSFGEAGLVQTGSGNLYVNNATMDINLYLIAALTTDIWGIQGDIMMSDTASLLLINGAFHTNNFDMTLGNILSINDPDETTDQRSLQLGSSTIQLAQRFVTSGDNDFNLDAGTSLLTLSSAGNYERTILTEGLAFHDVTILFEPLQTSQIIGGNNSFNKLKILAGSHVELMANSIQTVTDSLLILGTCNDSIYISSSTTDQAQIFKSGALNRFKLECINFSGINASGEPLEAFFSTNDTLNSNISFNAANVANASFTVDGPFCFGDTTFFTNNSTALSGNSGDLTFLWYFNDGSGSNTVDSIFYFTNVNSHVFQISDSIPVIMEAIYTNGCKDADTNYVNISRPQFFTSTNTFASAICPSHFLQLTSTSGSPSMQFQYFLNDSLVLTALSSDNTPFTTTSLQNQDTIEVVAFDQGCFADTSYIFTYEVYPIPTYSFTTSATPQEICSGDNVLFSGSSAETLDYRFLVNNTSVTAFQPGSGSYNTTSLSNNDEVYMIVRDQFNCLDTSITYTFTVNPLPSTTLAHSAPGNALCSGDEVTFTASGANTYSFLLNGVIQQGPSAADTWTTTTIEQGEVISVVGTSIDGCVFTAPQTFSYFVTPAPTTVISSSVGSSACAGDEIIFTGQGANNYEFFLNGVSIQGPSSNSNYASSSISDEDEIYVVGEANGCSSNSDSIQMQIFQSPSTALVNNIGSQTICQGTAVEFTASGANNYQFFINGNSQGAPSPTNSLSTTSLMNGDIVSVIGSIGTCSNNAQQQFTVLSNPIINLFSNNGTNALCDGDLITLTASGAANYTFFVNGANVQGPSAANTLVNPLLSYGANTIEAFGTATNGCSTMSAPLSVQLTPNPVVTISSNSPTNEICVGETIIFEANGASEYQFLINGATQTGLSANNMFSTSSLQNGDEVSVIGSQNGCTSNSGIISVVVNPVPSIGLIGDLGSNQFCEDILVNYTALGGTNYEFLVNGVSQGAPSSVNQINSSLFPTGSVTLQVIGESNGCTNTASTNLTIFPLPIPTITTTSGSTEFCANAPIEFTASGGSQYQFFINGVPATTNSFVSNFSSSSLNSGDIVSVNVTTTSGCSGTANFSPLTVYPLPNVTIISSNGANNICVGDEVIINASGAINYEFFLNGQSLGAPSAIDEILLTNLVTGDQVFVVGADANCQATSTGITFTSFGIPNVSLTNNTSNIVCIDESADLTANGAANYQFLINGNPAGAFSANSEFNQLVNNGDVVTVIGEANGCTSLPSNSIEYTVFNYPTVNFFNSSTSNTICIGDTVDFTATGAMSYEFEINNIASTSNTTGLFTTDNLMNGDEVTVIGLNAHCASAPIGIVFTVNSMQLELSVAPSSFICAGDLIEFEASGADVYEFTVNNSSVQGPGANSTYSSNDLNSQDIVSFIGSNTTTGCVQTFGDYIVMTVVDEPSISANGPLQFCEGDTVILFSNSSYGNQWFLNGALLAGETSSQLIVTESGAYALDVVKGGNGSIWSVGKNSSGIHGNGNNFNNTMPVRAGSNESFVTLSSGYEFILGKTVNGDIYTWGKNSSGQLGNGTFTSSTQPLLLSGVSNATVAATARSSAMVATSNGNVYVWGENNSGQLGLGNLSIVNFPLLHPTLTNVDTIAGGLEHFVILKNDGTVWTVGNNFQGQLGNNSLTNSNIPVEVAGLSNIIAIGAGEYHSFAIDINGNIYGWGNNSSGQLGLGDFTSRTIPVLLPLTDVIAITGGANHTIFLKQNGEVYATGGNLFGQLGIGNFTSSNFPKKSLISGVTHIAANQYNSLFLRHDYSVYGCGSNLEEQLAPVTNSTANTPVLLSNYEGVTFISASQTSTHVIYGVEQGCSSMSVNVIVDAVPEAVITVDGDELSTIQGTSHQWFFNGLPIPNSNSQSITATENGNYSVQVILNNGCIATSDVYVHQLVNIKEQNSTLLRVYPNPANETITLEGGLSQYDRLTILDNTGRVVRVDRISPQTEYLKLNISELTKGAYVLVLENNAAADRVKLIKN
jgi:alpha-tubulin suppressor-like RCC1 family protein